MAIKKYIADATTTIVNAYQPNLRIRGTGSNMGAADVIEVFSVYGRETAPVTGTGGSQELSRALVKFPAADIAADRTAGTIPDSGSVSFYLRVFNAVHTKTVPRDYKLVIAAVSQSWQEGVGLDLETYKDLTQGNPGCNWIVRNNTKIAQITKVTFSSDTLADYGAGSGENYISIYDGYDRYNLWFNDGSGDSAPSQTGTETEIDISSTTPAAASIAAQFNSVVNGLSGFSTNIDSGVNTIVYVTSSTAGAVDETTTIGTLSGIALSAQQTGREGTPWVTVGGDYITSSGHIFSQSFSTGLEDVEVDITPLVEKWVSGTQANYGVGIHLSNSYEAYFSSSTGENSGSVINNLSGAVKSYYTKRLFAKGTQYWYKRPIIEARWDSTVKDDRGDFYYSSSLAPAADNLNTLYIYNYVRGALTNIPAVGTGSILVSLYSGSSVPTGSKLVLYDGGTNLTGGWVSTGIYSCSVAITAASTPLNPLFDVWHSGGVEYVTGSIVPAEMQASMTISKPVYYINITNMRQDYRSDEVARFNLYVRNKDWQPTIYTVANNTAPATTIESASYRVYRVLDGLEVVPYGTGSDRCTQLSYGVSGNYFDFDMNNIQPGYEYAFKFAFYDPSLSSWSEQSETFKFRVEDYEY